MLQHAKQSTPLTARFERQHLSLRRTRTAQCESTRDEFPLSVDSVTIQVGRQTHFLFIIMVVINAPVATEYKDMM